MDFPQIVVDVAAVALALLVLVVGVAHLITPGKVEPLVPEWWPAKRLTVYASGIAEVVIGVGLLIPVTRPWAAGVAVLMFLAYTPSSTSTTCATPPAPPASVTPPAGS